MKGAIYYVAIATVIFSHVKISSFRAKAHLVFHWCLYNKNSYNCERFEPRSHFKSRLSLIVRVNVVLNRTVVVDSD